MLTKEKCGEKDVKRIKKSAPRKLGRTSLLTFCIKIVFLAWI